MSSPLSPTVPVPPRAFSSVASILTARKQTLLSRKILGACLHLIVFLIPLVAYTAHLETLEMLKQGVFIVLLVIALVAGCVTVLLERQVAWPRNWFHALPIIFGVGYTLLATRSVDLPLSFLGNGNQTAWAVVTLLGCILFYALILQYVQSTGHIYRLLLTLFLSAIVCSLMGLVQLFGGLFFPGFVSAWHNLTALGSIYSLTFFLAPVGVVAFVLLHQKCQGRTCPFAQDTPVTRFCIAIAWTTLVLSLLLSALVALSSLWTIVLAVLLIVVLLEFYRSRGKEKTLVPWAWLGGALLVALFFVFVHLPIQLRLPPEVSPNVSASWMIAQQTLRNHPLVGIGPEAWSYAYSLYRPAAINAYPFWNIRFDRSYSSFLTLLTTVGIGGVLLWLVMCVGLLMKGYGYIHRKHPEEVWWTFLIIVSGWLAITGISFVYNFTMAHQLMWWLLTALLAALTASSMKSVTIKDKSTAHFGAQFVLAASVLIALMGGVFMIRHVAAQIAYANTVAGFQSKALSLEQALASLEHLHAEEPWQDQYTQALSEAYLQRALSVMAGKPTQEQFAQVRNDVANAVQLMLATKDRHPKNIDNLFQLASIYQRIAPFTPGAYSHALQAYVDARALDPADPAIPYGIGQALLQQSEADRVATQVSDAQKKQQAQTAWTKDLQAAVVSFQEAIHMKSDYYAAHYQLGVAYERQGKIQDAINEVSQALRANNKDPGLAFELALLYERAGDHASAQSLLEQVVKVQPGNMNARWYLSVVYEEQRAYDKAIAQIDAMLAGDLKDNPTVTQRRATLVAERQANLAPSVQPLPSPIDASNTPFAAPTH